MIETSNSTRSCILSATKNVPEYNEYTEKVDEFSKTPKKKESGFCSYQFDMINIGGGNYRVPKQNFTRMGKVLKPTFVSMQDKAVDEVKEKRQKERVNYANYTHFLCIPVSTPQLMANYDVMIDKVLDSGIKNVERKCFERR